MDNNKNYNCDQKEINLSTNINFFYTGAIIGVSQTIIGHPIDTIKTLLQNNNLNSKNTLQNNSSITKLALKYNYKNLNYIRSNLISRLYAGVSYPLFINLSYNTLVYELHDKTYKKTNNHFVSGFISGGLMSFILNPFEVAKIRKQVNNNNFTSTKILKLNNNFKLNKIFVALPYTFLRESISTGFYFKYYFYLLDKNISAFQSGGFAGCISWLITYPIDTYKTRVQANTKYKMELNLKNFKSLWHGISFCLLRAYLVNGVGFYIYNKLTSL
jgi:solute carrier family 25 carnitine/acylcarnitine transporter 20/29